MKYFLCFLFAINSICCIAKPAKHSGLNFYPADDSHLKYVGRVDFSDPLAPKFWAPGIYVQAKFKGTSLSIDINDEDLYGVTHNYLEIAIDNNPPFRIQTTGKTNHIKVADNLPPGVHTVTICKDTESNIGYISFIGVTCEKLLSLSMPKRKMEFIGDSITCGTGSDQSVVKCDQGKWYDQHNAYMSYGPTTARALDAEWQLTSLSGIGLIHSCCNLKVTLPNIFDKVFLVQDSIQWNFSEYTPDVVTVCIGQNDGKQDSVTFCSAYVNFIKVIREKYPKADIVCLNSPMGNAQLTAMLKRYITGVQQYFNSKGDSHVSHYFFSRSWNDGCGGHPSMAQHALIAAELTAYVKQLKNW
jgi:lysophospholipase L1-like esterase